MKKNIGLKILAFALVLSSCSKESPELIPCMCDGSESTLGLFDCMCEPMKKKPVKRFSYLQDTLKPRYQTLILDEEQQDAYLYLHQRRDSFAPVKLEYVDFRIRKNGEYENYNTKLGNYRFRIFGCRRESKNVFLNEGRAMQKDMHFFDVFFETMNDYYPVVVDKTNPYYADSDKIEIPEYIMTAEITDYFMNICDEFDWENVKQKKLRSGSSEMTVVWRVMSLDKSEVYCRGMTTGYGQISEGEPNGETLLAERAFEDALTKVPELQCFNETLSQRIRPEVLAQQWAFVRGKALGENTFAAQYAPMMQGVELLQKCVADKVIVPGQKSLASKAFVTEASGGRTVFVDERGGVSGTGYATSVCDTCVAEAPCGTCATEEIVETVLEPVGDMVALTPIVEDSGIVGTGSSVAIDDECQMVAIDEDSRTVVKNVTVSDNIKVLEDYWVDVPLDTNEEALVVGKGELENSFANIDNSFCIKNNPPYEDMNPHNLYKVRASIVSVENMNGYKGAGLIIADNLILTSADLMVKNDNNFKIKTINGKEMKAAALRVNPSKNVALLMLDEPTKFSPLPLSLQLPEVNKDILMTLGLLNLDDEGEGYLDNEGKVIGYRWTESGDAEIIVDTFVQTVTLGGALIDRHGNIVGMAHKSKKDDETPDLFIPIETALKSLGLEICGREFGTRKPVGFKTFETPLADAIDNSKDKSPKPMKSGKK